jgi:cytochrome c-type biogenesis protein
MIGSIFNAGVSEAFVLGLLTSLQPCVLATAAGGVSWSLAWDQGPRSALVRGLAWVSGLCFAYAMLALSAAHLVPAESPFFVGISSRMAPFQGPFLLAAGALVTGVFGHGRFRGGQGGWGHARGVVGSFIAGVVLAVLFCPASAGIFFLLVVPSAVATAAPGLYAASYGAGIAAPMLAVVLAAVLGGGLGQGAWRLAGMIQLVAGVTLMLVGGVRTVRLVIQTIHQISGGMLKAL